MNTGALEKLRRDAKAIFQSGVQAVKGGEAVARHCRREGHHFIVGSETYDLSRFENIWLIGAGKAGWAMAHALESLLGDHIADGVVAVKYAHTGPLRKIRLLEAGHPVPDANGALAATEIIAMAQRAGPNDLICCLLSGGGSALTPLPVSGIDLHHKQVCIRTLMACGATIHEINAIRKHLSAFKGGRLAAAARPARMVTLMLSDVIGNDLDVIASGPTVADRSTFGECIEIVKAHGIAEALPSAVMTHLQEGAAGKQPETPKPGDDAFNNVQNLVVGNNLTAIRAAEREARNRGYRTVVLSSLIEGETREIARMHAAIAREVGLSGHPAPPPVCILSGGETTVTLSGDGLGGRNQEFALAAAMGIAGKAPIVVLSAGTDGTDGPTDAAGAIADGRTIDRAARMGLVPTDHLRHNDAYPFFKQLDDLLITGPTDTNVMDLRLMLVAATEVDPHGL